MQTVRILEDASAVAEAATGRDRWPVFGTLAVLDPDLALHSVRGTQLACVLARASGIEVTPAMFWAFLLHDVGTVDVPRRILHKPGPLTATEHDVVSGHAVRSSQLLEEVEALADSCAIARHHHERWDGSGYPDKLRATEIPVAARVLAVADTFAALTATRPHRPHMRADEAMEVILHEAGTQFDPGLALAFTRVASELPATLLTEPDVSGHLGTRLALLADRSHDLSRGHLEALFAVALGLTPEDAANRCGRSLGTHRNWVSSLRRSLNCPVRQPLQQFLGRLARQVFDAVPC